MTNKLLRLFTKHQDKSDKLVQKMKTEIDKEVTKFIVQQQKLKEAYQGKITKDLLKAMGAKV